MRRRPVRAAFLIIILATTALSTWYYLVRREQRPHNPATCPMSAPTQERIPLTALGTVAPIPPGNAEVGVLNATDRQGLAAQVATNLTVYGFTRARPAGNDLLHGSGTMRCTAQIVFGPTGTPAARTLALVLPCAQLVTDQRPDATVDLILGSAFSTLDPTIDARTILEQLQPHGGLQAMSAPATPIAPDLLAAANAEHC